ncbi:MAG: hypothetical protein QNJ47_21190 [Nostocaceae cyanobacterium]|nr:hypothetical protein [Nostocaceae cyanobacterium]
MKKLLRNYLIASVVAVTGVVSGASASFAGSATLDLSGTVTPSCNFDQASYSNNTPSFEDANYDIEWSGQFNVSCNNGNQVNITVDNVTTSGEATAARSRAGYEGEALRLQDGTNTSVISVNGNADYFNSLVTNPLNQGTINYSFVLDTGRIGGGQPLVAGTYGYNVTMTVAPN